MTFPDIFHFFAAGFGIGYLPYAPGTAGGLLGAVLAVGLHRLRRNMLLPANALLIMASVLVCEYATQNTAVKDPSFIVADEILTFPLATLTLPIRHQPLVLAGVFLTSRIVDTVKPPPIAALEQVPGGFGVVLDDVAANLLTLLAWFAFCRWKRINTNTGTR